MKEIKEYKVTLNGSVFNVYATSERELIEWLEQEPEDIKLIENTGMETINFNTCLALL